MIFTGIFICTVVVSCTQAERLTSNTVTEMLHPDELGFTPVFDKNGPHKYNEELLNRNDNEDNSQSTRTFVKSSVPARLPRGIRSWKIRNPVKSRKYSKVRHHNHRPHTPNIGGQKKLKIPKTDANAGPSKLERHIDRALVVLRAGTDLTGHGLQYDAAIKGQNAIPVVPPHPQYVAPVVPKQRVIMPTYAKPKRNDVYKNSASAVTFSMTMMIAVFVLEKCARCGS